MLANQPATLNDAFKAGKKLFLVSFVHDATSNDYTKVVQNAEKFTVGTEKLLRWLSTDVGRLDFQGIQITDFPKE